MPGTRRSIDNRFGEMFLWQLFWDRTLKDASIGSFLSSWLESWLYVSLWRFFEPIVRRMMEPPIHPRPDPPDHQQDHPHVHLLMTAANQSMMTKECRGRREGWTTSSPASGV